MMLNDELVVRECAILSAFHTATELNIPAKSVSFAFEFVEGRLIPEISLQHTPEGWTDDQVAEVLKRQMGAFKDRVRDRLAGNHQRRTRAQEETPSSAQGTDGSAADQTPS